MQVLGGGGTSAEGGACALNELPEPQLRKGQHTRLDHICHRNKHAQVPTARTANGQMVGCHCTGHFRSRSNTHMSPCRMPADIPTPRAKVPDLYIDGGCEKATLRPV